MRRSRSKELDAEYCCKIRLLDDSELSCDFKKDAKGEDVFSFVCKEMDLIEKDYFGLRYVDNSKQRHWLELNRELSKQLKNTRQPYMFFFRVRFYPTNPSKLHEEITRYQLFLQLKRDILHGRLLCPFTEITELAAHIVQAEAGDFDETEHQGNYISSIKLLPRQTEKLEDRIAEIHKALSGTTPVLAEEKFLDKAKEMDLYGVDPHPCRDQDDAQLYLGLTPQGIQVIRDAKRVSGFPWGEIHKVTYDSKAFYIQTLKDKKKTNYSFKLNDAPGCKHLWKCTIEQMAFYGGDSVKAQHAKRSTLSPQNLFKRKKYTYSGKTESQINLEVEKIHRIQPNFSRTPSIRMVTSRKTSAQQSRNSFALDDRASQIFSTTESGQRDLNVSNGDDDKERADERQVDHLKEFETSEFPPEPPLDASRTSLAVTDEDLSESDRSPTGPMESAEEDEIRPECDEKSAGEGARGIKLWRKSFLIFIILGFIALFLALLIEMKLNFTRRG
ncbi:FERM domain-containing protein 5-like [Rhopilema esculentum]|uniref:FERM domain-containing protein 5-like n=1 Tax=Rhopilema esculentum TaxID=499914 RepID=UPI0031DF0FE5